MDEKDETVIKANSNLGELLEHITTADIYRETLKFEKERRVVYVAFRQPALVDDNSPGTVLGVYNQKAKAEARGFRETKSGNYYGEPLEVIEIFLDADYDLEELDNPS